MLSVNIICIGKLKEKYLESAIEEYSKRLSSLCKFNIIELSEERLPDNPSELQIKKAIEAESNRILGKISKGDFVFSMCIEGKNISSQKLSEKLEKISLDHSVVDFIIGGSYGLSDELKARSNFKLSLGLMTFPHQLCRVILSEQIYRAFQISKNTKYHK